MDYKELYFLLFNRITDALEELEHLNIGKAKDILRQSQIGAEEAYLAQTEEP